MLCKIAILCFCIDRVPLYPAIFHKEDESYWVEFPDLHMKSG